MNLKNFTQDQVEEVSQQLINEVEDIINNLNKQEGVSIEKNAKTMYTFVEIRLYDVIKFIKETEVLEESMIEKSEEVTELFKFWKSILLNIKTKLKYD